MRIGLPRALLYHKYHMLWTTFLEKCGFTTVVSPPTNRGILERGVSLAVDESCLPMKVLLGHIEALVGRCDAVFVPRQEAFERGEHLCVKFMGAYDIVRNTIPDLRLVTYDVNADHGVDERRSMIAMARSLGVPARIARRAYVLAEAAQHAHEVELARLQQSVADSPRSGDVRILVVGHSYNLADELIGAPILGYLRTLGAEVVTSDEVDKALARRTGAGMSPTMKWRYNKELLGSVELYRDMVDGIVFVVTFPCGPDSLMAELCARRVTGIPMTTLVLDELAGEAGTRTRLESFVDILRERRRRGHVRAVGA
ncbi:MAG: acyl-CoA dehydratase activase-related protein [Actinomycetota bacterium]|nr:acyl-CoA dehydratase activase-related protein [Actinomycetota bacterium]